MFMDNNLNTMILRSGITKRIVAEQKGVAPETLSRHISGKIQLSLNDAEDYSKILGCAPQEILFASDPAPIVGYVHYDKAAEHSVDFIQYRKDKSKYHKTSPGGNVYLPGPIPFELGIVMFDLPDEYNGPWIEYKEATRKLQMAKLCLGIFIQSQAARTLYIIPGGKIYFLKKQKCGGASNLIGLRPLSARSGNQCLEALI